MDHLFRWFHNDFSFGSKSGLVMTRLEEWRTWTPEDAFDLESDQLLDMRHMWFVTGSTLRYHVLPMKQTQHSPNIIGKEGSINWTCD